MFKTKILAGAIATVAMAASCGAYAEEEKSPHSVTGNVTFTTNYHVRGVSQTNFGPAVQGTMEYGHASGFYLGAFGSNVSWYGDGWEPAAPGTDSNIYGGTLNTTTGQANAISNSFEVDVYAGFRNKFLEDFSYDVGAIYYYYPGKYRIDANTDAFGIKKPHTGEVYAGLGWKWISGKFYYGVTDSVFGVADAQGTYYLDLTATVPIGETGFSIIGHVGYWKWNGAMKWWRDGGKDNSVYDLMDYKLGVTKDWFGLTFGAFYWGSTADKVTSVNNPTVGYVGDSAVWGNRFGKNVGDDTFFVTVTKAF